MAGYEIAAATMSAETSFMFFASMFTAMAAAAEQHLADDQAGQPDDYHARTQRIVSKFLILGDERT